MAIVMWSFNAVERSLKFLCRFSGVLWGMSPMQTLEFLLMKEIWRGPVDMVNVLISSNIHEYRIMFNKYFNSFYIYTRTLCFSLYISSSPDVLYEQCRTEVCFVDITFRVLISPPAREIARPWQWVCMSIWMLHKNNARRAHTHTHTERFCLFNLLLWESWILDEVQGEFGQWYCW